ncbi:MAG TPA: hypothetical protein VLA19_00360 [Herpetosiphonaceae bacterium]|nr:hypothetical protein [Herpetosiphonaceae bacterium]
MSAPHRGRGRPGPWLVWRAWGHGQDFVEALLTQELFAIAWKTCSNVHGCRL